MPTETRVPGAASSEVDFELERFERTADDRIEVSGRWYGLRGRRFVRPVLNLNASGSRRRAIALLEHKPWAADDGETWLAAFRWPEGAGDVQSAELEVGPGLVVELPAPGGRADPIVRVRALRPHVPTPPGPAYHTPEEMGRREAALDDESPHAGVPDPSVGARGRGSAGGERSGGARGRGSSDGERSAAARGGGSSGGMTDHERSGAARGRGSAGVTDRERSGGARGRDELALPDWTASPPRDVLTAALAERDEAIAGRDEYERERLAALGDRDDALSRRDAALRDVERAGGERDEAVAERDRLAAEVERVTRDRDIAHAERSRTLQDAELVARERDQAAAERDAARSELARALPARDEAIRERDAETTRADRAESERDTAFAERKSAVAQRDRARRERDRAMRASGVEPPEESPYVSPAGARSRPPGVAADVVEPVAYADPTQAGAPGDAAGSAADLVEPVANADPGQAGAATRSGTSSASGAAGGATRSGTSSASGDATRPRAFATGGATLPGAASASGAATQPRGAPAPGTPLPSRPIKRLGSAPAGPAPESKPLLTPVDAGPRRLSRTRRAPSAPARWAVRIVVLLLLLAMAIVLLILVGRAI